jgi:hypothetical protein
MQAQSRHQSLDVLSGYVRAHELFEDHAGGPSLWEEIEATIH